jgi:iron-sulfur cluster assembly protein
MSEKGVERAAPHMITFTPEAIAQWRLEHPEPSAAVGPAVRVSVASGGCAGLKYVLEAAVETGAADLLFPQDGLTVLCAPADLPRLDGLTIGYVDAMVGGGYRFDNPNAGHACGCGASFEDKNRSRDG